MGYVWVKNGVRFKNPLEYNGKSIINPKDSILIAAGYQKVEVPIVDEANIIETCIELPEATQYFLNKTYFNLTDKQLYICIKDNNSYIWDSIKLSKDNVLETITELPTASEDYLNKIYMYVGMTTQQYILGKVYKCIYKNNQYQWVELSQSETLNTVSNIICHENPSNGVILQWEDPADANWEKTVIVKKVGGYPTSPSDGTTVLTNTVRNQYKTTAYIDNKNSAIHYRWFTYSFSGLINDDENSKDTCELTWVKIKHLTELNNIDLRDYFTLGNSISTYNSLLTTDNSDNSLFSWQIVDINQHNMKLLALNAYTDNSFTAGYSKLQTDISQKNAIFGESSPWDNIHQFGLEFYDANNDFTDTNIYEYSDPDMYNHILFFLVKCSFNEDNEVVEDKNRVWRTINGLFEIHYDVALNSWVIYNTFRKAVVFNINNSQNNPEKMTLSFGEEIGLRNYSIYYISEDDIETYEAEYGTIERVDQDHSYQWNDSITIDGTTYYRTVKDAYELEHSNRI